jgi:hypothetical protein
VTDVHVRMGHSSRINAGSRGGTGVPPYLPRNMSQDTDALLASLPIPFQASGTGCRDYSRSNRYVEIV